MEEEQGIRKVSIFIALLIVIPVYMSHRICCLWSRAEIRTVKFVYFSQMWMIYYAVLQHLFMHDNLRKACTFHFFMETGPINIAMLRNPAVMKENTIPGTNLETRLVQIGGRSTELEVSFNFTHIIMGRENIVRYCHLSQRFAKPDN